MKFRKGELYVFMAFDPWEPFVATVINTEPRVEILSPSFDGLEIGYIELVKDWPIGEVYWNVQAPTSRRLIEYLCTAEDFVVWFDIWDQFERYQGDDNSEKDKFKFACIAFWDSKRPNT